jgi:hypothetical protein
MAPAPARAHPVAGMGEDMAVATVDARPAVVREAAATAGRTGDAADAAGRTRCAIRDAAAISSMRLFACSPGCLAGLSARSQFLPPLRFCVARHRYDPKFSNRCTSFGKNA